MHPGAGGTCRVLRYDARYSQTRDIHRTGCAMQLRACCKNRRLAARRSSTTHRGERCNRFQPPQGLQQSHGLLRPPRVAANGLRMSYRHLLSACGDLRVSCDPMATPGVAASPWFRRPMIPDPFAGDGRRERARTAAGRRRRAAARCAWRAPSRGARATVGDQDGPVALDKHLRRVVIWGHRSDSGPSALSACDAHMAQVGVGCRGLPPLQKAALSRGPVLRSVARLPAPGLLTRGAFWRAEAEARWVPRHFASGASGKSARGKGWPGEVGSPLDTCVCVVPASSLATELPGLLSQARSISESRQCRPFRRKVWRSRDDMELLCDKVCCDLPHGVVLSGRGLWGAQRSRRQVTSRRLKSQVDHSSRRRV